MSRAQKYPAPVAGNVPTNVPTMYPWQGKMGENGGKWGKMGEKWGKMGENGEKIRKLGWCNRSPASGHSVGRDPGCLLLHSTIGGGIIPYQGLIVAGVPNINNKA